MNRLHSRRNNKDCWFFGVSIVLVIAVVSHFGGTIFYVNRTASMPMGIYVKLKDDVVVDGDVIVFRHPHQKNNLIKYVLKMGAGEYCFDELGSVWLDGNPIAEINIEKFSNAYLNQSNCHLIEPGEIFVMGDHQNSYDSRYFGTIKKSNVIAKVTLLYEFN